MAAEASSAPFSSDGDPQLDDDGGPVSGDPPLVSAAPIPSSLPDSDGVPVTLWQADLATLVVLVPFAFSPVCTDELGALETIAEDLRARRARALVVSCDAVPTLREWRERLRTSAPLLSDFWPHGALSRALGGFDERRGTARRLTVLLDGSGRELWRVQSPGGRPRQSSQYLRALDLAGHRP